MLSLVVMLSAAQSLGQLTQLAAWRAASQVLFSGLVDRRRLAGVAVLLCAFCIHSLYPVGDIKGIIYLG